MPRSSRPYVGLALGLALLVAPARADLPESGIHFGIQSIFNGRFDLLPFNHVDIYELVSTPAWARLMPDGENWNTELLATLDNEARKAAAVGMVLEMRVTTKGGPLYPFQGPKSGWPVDATPYEFKMGEWLGDPLAWGGWSYPPKVLTDDSPGNESPWYDFVSALVARYDGTFPDPLNPGETLPRIDLWSVIEEPDSKGFYYGTTTEFFGGVGGNPAVGIQPSFYRAVKATNPDALVMAGGITSHNVGFHIAHQKAEAAGNLYTQEVKDWAIHYFRRSRPRLAEFTGVSAPTDPAELFDYFENEDLEQIRSSSFIDALMAGSAYYDILAVHVYHEPTALDAVLDLFEPAGKPLWITEMGFVDNPKGEAPGYEPLTHDGQKRGIFQYLAIATSRGVENASYSTFFDTSYLGTRTVGVYRTIAAHPKPAQRTWQTAAWALRGASARDIVNASGAVVHRFDRPDGGALVAWNDAGTATLDLVALSGAAPGTPVFAYDMHAKAYPDPTSVEVGADPVVLRYGTDLVDADGDRYPFDLDCDDADLAINPGIGKCEGNPDEGCDGTVGSAGAASRVGGALVLIGLALARARRRPSRRTPTPAVGRGSQTDPRARTRLHG